ncbi:hypothetical protein CcI6DRAFT_03192 [Frankia sp. CcI6]|nr:hypothetical protein CcI6DRAFT_03192 [Frankia sp. CcI6]KEZ34714.1 hypothetical protein CEDDRAFT_03925 [Frankia sp. CeD]KFB03976.1 hypothetical protein ALLO2DRAFT_03327 [Frankia sp. Allo2]OAA23068.1 hypothetical protein AAY23_10579 [Frankia casuarinae]
MTSADVLPPLGGTLFPGCDLFPGRDHPSGDAIAPTRERRLV